MEHSLIFENVHKKHQFAELFKITLFEIGMTQEIQDRDFRILTTTWNMG